jgi:predicted RNA-binding protein
LAAIDEGLASEAASEEEVKAAVASLRRASGSNIRKRAIADLRQIAVYYTGPAIRSLLQESQPAFKRSSHE